MGLVKPAAAAISPISLKNPRVVIFGQDAVQLDVQGSGRHLEYQMVEQEIGENMQKGVRFEHAGRAGLGALAGDAVAVHEGALFDRPAAVQCSCLTVSGKHFD